jgi:5,6,7,8-tetrahydromethanopterin hydro-lyase
MSMYIGEALAGEGAEIAHIDVLIGNKSGPVGVAFANALAGQSEGHSNLLTVLTTDLAVKPATVMITKVTIKGMKQAVQMFGPAQAAVAKAVADSVAAGVVPKDKCEDLVIVCAVFIHPAAADDRKIYDYNYAATKQAIASALAGKPSAVEMLAGKDTVRHPFRGNTLDYADHYPGCGPTGSGLNTVEGNPPDYHVHGRVASCDRSHNRNNLWALTGFVLGCCSIPFSFIGILPIAALVCSIVGVNTFRQDTQKNSWMGPLGIVLGAMSFLAYLSAWGHL